MASTVIDTRGLESVSNDVVLMILEALHDPEDLRCIAYLARTCKRLNQLATPVLYKVFPQPKEDEKRLLGIARPWLCVFLSRSLLADHVREISICAWDIKHIRRGTQWSEEARPPSQDVQALHYTALKRLFPCGHRPRCDELQQQVLCSDHESAEFAHLLSLTPNLNKLWMALPYDTPDVDLFTAALRRAAERDVSASGLEGKQPFWNLRTVTIESSMYGTRTISLKDISKFLSLPVIRLLRLRGSFDEKYDEAVQDWSRLARKSPIRNLIVEQGCLSMPSTLRLVQSCASLQSLHCSVTPLDREVDFTLLAHEVSYHKDSLEEFSIRGYESRPRERSTRYWTPPPSSPPPPLARSSLFGSFSGYKALKQFKVPQDVLFAPTASHEVRHEDMIGVLPPNVECLRLRDCDESVVKYLKTLLRMKPSHHQHLRTIFIDGLLQIRALRDNRDAIESYARPRVPRDDPSRVSAEAAIYSAKVIARDQALEQIYELKAAFRSAKVYWISNYKFERG